MVDQITLSVIKGALEQATYDMDIVLIRSAMSPIIAETNDMANGIYHPVTGETIAQGSLGLPVFLSNMQFRVQSVLRMNIDFKPGDIIFTNDPYLGGTHLQDAQFIRPVFYDGELFCFLSNTGHFMDIGGGTPGGWAPKATEIYQEGIIVPPVKLYQEGKLNEDLLNFFLRNVRLPEQIRGDMEAMKNALELGEARLIQIIERYGKDAVMTSLNELIVRSEKQMESYIEEIPDGVYTFEDYLDNDGIIDKPLKIKLTITVKGSKMNFDFTGTDPHAIGPMNLSRATSICGCYIALKHIFPDVPINGGTFKPVTIQIPENTLLDAKPPRSVSGYLEVLGRVIDVTFGALSQAIPDKVPAAFFGTIGVMNIAGVHPETKKYFVGTFPYPGGYGAFCDSDGLLNATPPQSMANFMSIESAEHRFPIMFEYYKIREGSAGHGTHRGGPGTSFAIRSLSDDLVVSILGDRMEHAPFGIVGGQPGKPNRVVFHLKDGDVVVSKIDKQPLRKGEWVEAHSPGGGGHGDPKKRSSKRVLEDLNHGLITEEEAKEIYGLNFEKKQTKHGYVYYELLQKQEVNN